MKRNQFIARLFEGMSNSNPDVRIRVKRSDGSIYERSIENVYFSVRTGKERIILEVSDPPEMPKVSEVEDKE